MNLAAWPMNIFGAVVIAAMTVAAHAEPPAGSDPNSDTAHWYQSLAQPGTGYLCCSVADCRNVVYRTRGDHMEAFIDRKSFGPNAPDDWVVVPANHVLRGKVNPTGEAVACFYNGEIHCFVEASGV